MLGKPKGLVRSRGHTRGQWQGQGLSVSPSAPTPPPQQLLGELMNKPSRFTEHVSSQPQHYKVPYSPLERSCMSNRLNECYIIYKFHYY